MIRGIIAFFGAILIANAAQASVWPITSDWTLEKEEHFGQWIEKITNPESLSQNDEPLFQPGGPLSGIFVDCADFVYAARILFAAENGLPFSSKVSFQGKALDASRSHWDSIPQKQRLRAFLKDVINGTGTWSLPRDTVAITEISRAQIKSGTVLLASPAIGHSWLIRKVRTSGIPELVFASVPARQELFYRDGLPRGEAVFGKLSPGSQEAGFRSFCIPGKSCPKSVARTELNWSQHSDWRPLVLKALEIEPETLVDSVGREVLNLCRDAKTRAKLVQEAGEVRRIKQRCLRGADYYFYSTPNRDSRFKEGFLDLWELWMTTNDAIDEARTKKENLHGDLLNVFFRIGQVFSDFHIDERRETIVCPIEILPGKNIPLRDIRQNTINERLSPDPNESVEARWGLAPESGSCLGK